MKKKQTNTSFSKMLKTVNNYFNRLFFINDHRDFDRLKNFIASWRIWPPQSPKGEDGSVFRFRFIDPIVGVEDFQPLQIIECIFHLLATLFLKKVRAFAYSCFKFFASMLLCELCVKQKNFVSSRLIAFVLKNNSRREFIHTSKKSRSKMKQLLFINELNKYSTSALVSAFTKLVSSDISSLASIFFFSCNCKILSSMVSIQIMR